MVSIFHIGIIYIFLNVGIQLIVVLTQIYLIRPIDILYQLNLSSLVGIKNRFVA